MGVYHGFEKNETATMFFLKKPSLVYYSSVINGNEACYCNKITILY